MKALSLPAVEKDSFWSKVDNSESCIKAIQFYKENYQGWLNLYKKYKPKMYDKAKNIGPIEEAYDDYLTDLNIEIQDFRPSESDPKLDWYGTKITSNHIYSRFRRSNYTDFFDFFIANKKPENGTFMEWLDYQIELKSGSISRLAMVWDKFQEDLFDARFTTKMQSLEEENLSVTEASARAYVAAAYPDLKFDSFEDVEAMIIKQRMGDVPSTEEPKRSTVKSTEDIIKSKLQAFPVINRKMEKAPTREEAEVVYDMWWTAALDELIQAPDFDPGYGRKINVPPTTDDEINKILSMKKPSFKKQMVVGIDNIGNSLKQLALFKCFNNMVTIRKGQSAEKWGSGPGFISSKKYGNAGTKDKSSATKGFSFMSDGIAKA